jgi:UDP-N-acetyl-D-glucosamine dehydrogenase
VKNFITRKKKKNYMQTHSILSKISNQSLTVAILGLGYVGVPLMTTIAKKNIKVIGYDVCPKKITSLKNSIPYLNHMDSEFIRTMIEKSIITVTNDEIALHQADILILCVPTPLTKNNTPDMQYIESATQTIKRNMRPNQMIILESTTYPGTMTDCIIPILEQSGLKHEKDFLTAYSPEREDPGNKKFNTATIPKIVGADSLLSRKIVTEFYQLFIDHVVPVSSTKCAEAVKLVENIFRCVNIGLVNELKIVFDRMGIDTREIIDAAATKPFGFMPFYPGPGIGGHCIPIDPLYLTWKSHEFKTETRFIKVATEINQSMPRYTVDKLTLAMNDRLEKCLKNSKILVIGLAYKKNISDYRESPAAEVIKILKQRQAHLTYYDPFVNLDEIANSEYKDIPTIKWTNAALKTFDSAIILTDHDTIDWSLLLENVPLILDTRHAIKDGNFINLIH